MKTVYIRISHKSRTDYIPTFMLVHKSGMRKGEIVDHTVLANCAIKIKEYVDKLNRVNISRWSVAEIKKYLIGETEGISFTEYADEFIRKMKSEGREKPAQNYRTALNSLKQFMNLEQLMFTDITAGVLREWIDSLSGTARAKNLYPTNISVMFEAGRRKYNDYERNIIHIPWQPFRAVDIPNTDIPQKRAVEAEIIRKIHAQTPKGTREQLALDYMMLSLKLAAINAADLYLVEKNCFHDGKLCYCRKKTASTRRDRAYFEIRVMDDLLPLFEKYRGKQRLFNFSDSYSSAEIFLMAVNRGLKSLCLKAGDDIPHITSYWLRHSWATIARNDCGASMEDVAFCLNHASAHRITEDYIKKDFSTVDRVNRKVIDFIFFGQIS
jgi:integrase